MFEANRESGVVLTAVEVRTGPKHLSPKRARVRRRRLLLSIAVVAGAVGAATAITYSPGSNPFLPAASGMRLIFKSNFTGTQLNRSVWDTCYPWFSHEGGCTNFGNREYEWYLPSQVKLTHGVLDLVADQRRVEGRTKKGAPKSYVCSSGMVTTYPGFRFEYGYVQIVARIPDTEGLWSGLWMGAANFQWPPEIDLIEYWGRRVNAAGVYFHPYGAPVLADYPRLRGVSEGWHTYAVDWTPTRLTWFIDGRAIMTTSQDVPHQRMYILADLAYTSTSPVLIETGSGCHGILAIKSIKVWQ